MSTEKDLSNYLGGIVNPTDPILRAIYVDPDGVPVAEPPPTSPGWNQGSLCNELKQARSFLTQLNNFYDISKSEGRYLDYLGNRLGVVRYVGELDASYFSRIQSSINGGKLTKYNLIQILKIFSPNLATIQEGSSGVGYYRRSFFRWATEGLAGNNPGLMAEVTSPVVAISQTGPNHDTFTLADASDYAVGDEIWHYGTTTLMHRIAQIVGNDVIIDTRGYVSGVLVANTLSIDNSSLGEIRRYPSVPVLPAYFGSNTNSILLIKATVESNAVTNNPIIAKFLYDLMNQAKVPGSRVLIFKV